jgi:hypothetical protein
MKKKFFGLLSAGALFLSLAFISCKKEDSSTDEETVEAVTDQAVFALEESANAGKNGCYDLVFPVGFSFPDGTTKTVNNYDEMVSTIRSWARENCQGRGGRRGNGQGRPDGANGTWNGAKYRPTLVLPVTVISETGETIAVSTSDELKALRESCGKGYFAGRHFRGHARNCTPCITINFPVSVLFPDGSTQQAADRSALQTIARTWHQSNPNSSTHPEIVFPISVTRKDGTVVSVNNKDELKALRTSCN